jgi:hypothetical protein
MFGYFIPVKVGWTINSRLKINHIEAKTRNSSFKLESIMEAKPLPE